MPLEQKKSKKAFEHNVKAEMESGKPQKQALAIAYSVKRKPKRKKFVTGGEVSESVQNEFGGKPAPSDNSYSSHDLNGPAPSQADADASRLKELQAAKDAGMSSSFTPKMSADYKRLSQPQANYDGGMIHDNEDSKHQIARNAAKKALSGDEWTDNPVIPKPKLQPLKKPRMVPSDAYSTRLYNKEGHLMESEAPNNGPQEQPEKDYDEEGPDRQGPSVPALKMKKMANGGKIEDDADHQAKKHNKAVDSEYGGKIEDDEIDEPEGLESDNDEESPAVDEYMASHFAKGGILDEEEDMDHEDSIAAAIMAKRNRMHAAIDSGAMDMDSAVRMADGGEVDLDLNSMEQPNAYYGHNEDALKNQSMMYLNLEIQT
jgi:hypothetical protein